MALPPSIQLVTVTFGPFVDFQGAPVRGSTTFEPSTAIRHEATGTPILNRPITVEWDPDGMGAVVLPATDSTGLNVTGFTYRVSHRTYDNGVPAPLGGHVALPSSAPNVDLDVLVPVPASNGIVVSQPGVTSIAGLTGAPTAQQVVTALDVPLKATLVARPSSGSDGQALVKSGTDVVWGAAGLTPSQIVADPTIKGAFGSALRRRQVATRAAFPAFSRNVTNTGGTNTQVQQISSFTLTEDVSDLAFTFGNFYRDSAGDMALNGLSNITIRLGLYDGSQTYPIFWENGSRDLVLEPGAVATTRPLFFKGKKGQKVWLVRRMTWATAPTAFPAATIPASTGTQVNEWGTALADRTTSYGQFFTRTAGNFAVFPPLAVTATAKPGPVVGILGDSIASDGTNDYNADEPDTGWAMGGLGEASIPYINMGTASLQSTHILSSKAGRSQLFAALLAAGATHLLYALSTNDWSSGRTSAQLLADLATLKAELDPLGIKLIPCTSLPKTNATNNGQLAGETATFTERAAFNAALRANNGVGYGFYELARVVENPTDQNLWRTDIRAAAGISLVSGGTGYKNGDYLRLPGGGGITVTTSSGGVITAVGGTPAFGGWLVDPAATFSPYSVVSDDFPSQGIAAGAGAVLSYTGIAAATSTADGTHPQAPVTRLVRQDFASKAPALFTV